MPQSLYIDFVKKYFAGVVTGVIEKLNGEKTPRPYLFKTLLRPEYSVTGKWESLFSDNRIVMADIVALDSRLPLKSRKPLGTASGDLPKIGKKYKLNESQMMAIDVLIARGGREAEVARKLFDDSVRSITGVYERNEALFLEALSTGMVEITDDDNVGVAIRADFGIPAANKFGVTALWADAAAKPFDDFQRVFDAAGQTPAVAYLDKATFNKIAMTDQARALFAAAIGINTTNAPVPNVEQLNAAIAARYGFAFFIIDRKVYTERDGVQTQINPWKAGQITFTNSGQIGSLVYHEAVESNHRIAGTEYKEVDGYILVSKYRKEDPLQELTGVQGMALPVLNGAADIYMLDSTTLQA